MKILFEMYLFYLFEVHIYSCSVKYSTLVKLNFLFLKNDMNHAEAYVKFLCQWLPDNCLDDMEFMADTFNKTCINRLRMVSSTPF